MKLIIIGGDAAGMSAASQAKRQRPDLDVVVLEATSDVSYGACGLPYKLPEDGDMESLNIISAESFRRDRGLDLRLEHEATRIIPSEHRVIGRGPSGSFDLRYDRLVLATGARVRRPRIPGLAELWHQGVFPLKTLDDGRRLKAMLDRDRPRSAIVIGGGYIGLEATENLHQRGMQVTVVEALPKILPFMPQSLTERILREAARHGVEVITGAPVLGLERASDGKIHVMTRTAGELSADLVLASLGVEPRSELASEAGLRLSTASSIAVDEHLFTSDPDILAAGDCADAQHAVSRRPVWIPLALRANRAGKLAGQNALGGRLAKAPPVLGTAVFRFFGLEVARTGLSEDEAAQAGFSTASIDILASTRAAYYPGGGKLSVWLLGERGSGRLLGGAMVGPEGAAHRIDTVAAALHAGLTATDLYDMDLGYAPPFGPSWSPLLTAASALVKAAR